MGRLHTHTLRKKCPYWSFCSPTAGKYGPEKLQIQTLFRQWEAYSQYCQTSSCLILTCFEYASVTDQINKLLFSRIFFKSFLKIQSFYWDEVLNLKQKFLAALVIILYTKFFLRKYFEKPISRIKWKHFWFIL